MLEPDCIVELRRRLNRHGLPRPRLDRIVREAAEHWEDARAEGLEAGLEATAAAARADHILGEPAVLAKSFTKRLRRQSWLGRHPVLAVLFLPTLLVLLAFCLFALPMAVFDGFADTAKKISMRSPGGLRFIVCSIWMLYVAGTAFAPVTLSWWAWRSGLGRRFMLFLCAGCALATSVRFLRVDPVQRFVAFGFGWPNFGTQTALLVLLHLVVAGVFLAVSRRAGPSFPFRPFPEPIQAHEA